MKSAISAALLAGAGSVFGAAVPSNVPTDKCPGYKASNVKTSPNSVTADLKLAGENCNAYGTDLENLKLVVNYETNERLHVQILDAEEQIYQVPESVFPRPAAGDTNREQASLRFDYKENPFSFTVTRADNNEVLFDSSASSLIAEPQYMRLRTKLPDDPYLYGLGEHTDSFRLLTTNYTRTIWNLDNPGVNNNENLYGAHPLYVDHRMSGTHGVFLLNSNGMDIKIDKDASGQYLEYNTIGGIFDFYFIAGPSPIEVSKQYAEIAGLPALAPYAGLGYHNCRWGYQDAYDLAEVVYNYSKAEIPLETMWSDIDYMDGRSIFSLDPERFPKKMVRELVDYLHDHKQYFVVMVDPAVAAMDYAPYNRGVEQNAYLFYEGDVYHGAVWPGATAYPDWFAEPTQDYWNNEFDIFFDESDGVDIDFLWIDMNEPSNFCPFPCENATDYALNNNLPPAPPPVRSPPRPLPGFSCDFQPEGECKRSTQEQDVVMRDQRPVNHVRQAFQSFQAREALHKGLPDRDLLFPKYKIANDDGELPAKTARTDLIHANGLTLYDTHNLYGSMMSTASRKAMLARRPSKRPMVITRSTFAGAGRDVGHWLGDNVSTWSHYLWSIRGMLAFNTLFQIPIVGSDVCGFGDNTTEELCARWAMLGAFNPFYRNHNAIGQTSQEFYRWETVAAAARKAIDIRYRLLDYFYTALHEQSSFGLPSLYPMFYLYPDDKGTFDSDTQFFYGPSILVAPVIEQGSTSASVYMPKKAIFYNFYTHEKIIGEGKVHQMTEQSLTDIPLFYRGGTITPQRVKSGMTTSEVREQDFELVIALDERGVARGSLYLDDGENLEQEGTTLIEFTYKCSTLYAKGQFGYPNPSAIVKITVLDGEKEKTASVSSQSREKEVKQALTGEFKIRV